MTSVVHSPHPLPSRVGASRILLWPQPSPSQTERSQLLTFFNSTTAFLRCRGETGAAHTTTGLSISERCSQYSLSLLNGVRHFDLFGCHCVLSLSISTACDCPDPQSGTFHYTRTQQTKTLSCIFLYYVFTAAKYTHLKILTLVYTGSCMVKEIRQSFT